MIVNPRSVFLSVGLLLLSVSFIVLYQHHDDLLEHISTFNNLPRPSSQPQQVWSPPTPPPPPPPPPPPWAYATFLSTRSDDEEKDPYFTATRVLVYQLLHQPSTKTQLDIPLLILVPPHVSAKKRDTLTAEGATVVVVDDLSSTKHWEVPSETRFVDQFTKLRLFEQTQYERILYMDSDMLLTRNLDGIWKESVAKKMQTTKAHKKGMKKFKDANGTEIQPPKEYLVAGISDTFSPWHDFPPPTGDEMNGGFMMLRPDQALFDYYHAILDTPESFDTALMEQSLLNFAHKKDGRMPWKAFKAGKWNVNWPNEEDFKHGCATLHDKFWDPGNKDWLARPLVEKWWRVQGRAEGFWQRRNDSVPETP